MKDDHKVLKWNISATTDRILLKFETQHKGTKPKFKIACNEDSLQWKTSSNYQNRNTSVLSGKYGEDSEENLSVALLSPACSVIQSFFLVISTYQIIYCYLLLSPSAVTQNQNPLQISLADIIMMLFAFGQSEQCQGCQKLVLLKVPPTVFDVPPPPPKKIK